MARISTTYDKDIKEKLFFVRGDERYTRSTSTIIEERECVVGADGFVQDIFVNVLRDVGNAGLVVYDNDVALFTVNDWTSIDSGRVITLPMLSYDTDHNIKVKYIGNSQCSPSMSKTILINQPNTYRTSSSLIFPDTVIRHITTPNREYNVTVVLTNENDNPLYNKNQLLDVYYDGNLIDTVETDNDGAATVTYSSTEEGLHTLYVKFKGTKELYPTQSATLLISAGYWFELTDAPLVQLDGEAYSFKGKVHTYFESGNAGHRVDVTLLSVPNNVELDTQETGVGGKVTFSDINTHSDQFKFKMSKSNYDYYSEVYSAPYYVPQSVSLQSSTDRMYKGETTTFTMQIDRPLEGVPIVFETVREQTQQGGEEGIDAGATTSYEPISSTTVYTNNNGVATTSVIADGGIHNWYRAKVGNVYSNVRSLAGYITYWSKIGEYLKKGTLDIPYATLLELQDVFRLDGDRDARLDFPVPPNSTYPWNIIIEGITTPTNAQLDLGLYDVIHPEREGKGTVHPCILPSRKYTNARLTLVGRTDTMGLAYQVYENNSIIYTGEIQDGYFHPSLSFINGLADSQQFSFRQARYYYVKG